MRYVLAVAAGWTAVCSFAADYTFSDAGGDLADPAKWGGTLPGPADKAIINQPGEYNCSSNEIAVAQIKVSGPAGDYKFYFSDNATTVKLATANHPLDIWSTRTGKLKVYLKKGIWDFGGVEFRGQEKQGTLFLTETVITNVAGFYSAYYTANNSGLYMYSGAQIFSSEFRLANKDTVHAGLHLYSGSRIVTGQFYSDTNHNTPGTAADNVSEINGEGSKIDASDVVLGFKTSRNRAYIENGGEWIARGSFRLGNSNISHTNLLCVNNGTLTVAGAMRISDQSTANAFVATNSTIAANAITNNGIRSVIDFQNCNVTANEFVPFLWSNTYGGGHVRFGGANSSIALGNVTALKSGGHLDFDDNIAITWPATFSQWMKSCTNCLVSVTRGANVTLPVAMYIGYTNDRFSHDNRLEVLSGGLLTLPELRTFGTNNTVVVSNGTIRATDNYFIVGYSRTATDVPPHGNSLTMQGNAPRVEAPSFWIRGDSVLRFELSATGYASGYAPIVSEGVVFHPTAKIEVDYADYLMAGGGEVTLMAFDTEVPDSSGVSFAQWITDQNAAMSLPPGCRLRLRSDENGYRVVFKAKRPAGIVVNFK